MENTSAESSTPADDELNENEDDDVLHVFDFADGDDADDETDLAGKELADVDEEQQTELATTVAETTTATTTTTTATTTASTTAEATTTTTTTDLPPDDASADASSGQAEGDRLAGRKKIVRVGELPLADDARMDMIRSQSNIRRIRVQAVQLSHLPFLQSIMDDHCDSALFYLDKNRQQQTMTGHVTMTCKSASDAQMAFDRLQHHVTTGSEMKIYFRNQLFAVGEDGQVQLTTKPDPDPARNAVDDLAKDTATSAMLAKFKKRPTDDELCAVTLYVHGLSPSADERDLARLFPEAQFCHVAVDHAGKSKGCGYLQFLSAKETQEAFQKYRREVIEHDGCALSVHQVLTKEERENRQLERKRRNEEKISRRSKPRFR